MATTLRHRRGSTSSHNSFTGASGEITVDTSKNVAVVHDGSTVGGFEMLREDMSNINIGGSNSSGNVIQSDGDGTYSFASITTGKILQVQSLDFDSLYQDSSGTVNSFRDITGFSLAITPSSTSSRIIISVNLGSAGITSVAYRIVRGSTAINVGTHATAFNGGFKTGDTSTIHNMGIGFMQIDSPSTTSSTTYKLQGAFYDSSRGISINRQGALQANTYYGAYRSNMMLMEVGP